MHSSNDMKLIFCECCGKMKPWSTIYRGLQSRGNLMAVCPACKEYLKQLDNDALVSPAK